MSELNKMPRTKKPPTPRKRTLTEIAKHAIESESNTFSFAEQIDTSSQISNCLNLHPYCVQVYNTPESHAIYEQAELREPDESLNVLEPKPWEKNAPPEARALAKQYSASPELFFERVIKKDAEECAKDASYPQRSPGWLQARSTSITASDFSSAVCRNPYKSSVKFLNGKVNPNSDSFSSKYAQWGVDHEEHAEEAFVEVLADHSSVPFRIDHPHMFKHVDAQWIAVSPDGIITYKEPSGGLVVDLIEYKAPAYYRHENTYPYMKHKGGIPPHYYDQIQGTMWLMKKYDVFPNCRTVRGTFFVVWQPHALSVMYIPYSESYATALCEKVKAFYFSKFIPTCIEQLNS
jgi:putative phage-type endonuclease